MAYEKLERMYQRFQEIERLMGTQEVATNPASLQSLGKEHAALHEPATAYASYLEVEREIADTAALLEEATDPEMRHVARDELVALENRRGELSDSFMRYLVDVDPNDQKDVIVEIRAGTGGEEASLFAADLFRMYTRYAQRHGWSIEVIDSTLSGAKGFKEIVFEVRGQGVYSRLKFERGVHRVQRVPLTEASGRIHTSAATVAVLPEAEEVEIDINPDEIRTDIYHSGGAGGQNVNKVATAVRLTHVPTGIVAICQDERSQLKNRIKAMAVLRARLYDAKSREQSDKIEQDRRSQVGTGDRSEKMRTYNYPQDRITDHRIGQSYHNMERLLDGDLDELIDALNADSVQQAASRT
ncbi:MAG: peptide chain release factor 1 [Dehalococcoidia bacterium]|nr:MAG: peptide chain release factor 1 [Dehalococcoidia bacterium]